MNYHFSKRISLSFDETVEKVKEELEKEGFGIVTTIDMKKIFSKNLHADFWNYTILGACKPRFAYEILLEEDKSGVFLPCNIVIQEHDKRVTEVSIANPEETIRVVGNPNLNSFAAEVKESLLSVLGKI